MILYTKSMEQLGAFVSSLYLNLIPIVTIAFGFLLLGEKLSLMEFAGGGLILVSVIIPRVEFRQKARD
jgi:drug/metabolite transporter (DMT)-like permease